MVVQHTRFFSMLLFVARGIGDSLGLSFEACLEATPHAIIGPSCFMTVTPNYPLPTTEQEGQDLCGYPKGFLAVLATEEDISAVELVIRPILSLSSYHLIRVGCFQDPGSPTDSGWNWKYPNGTKLSLNPQLWKSGQPNDAATVGDDACILEGNPRRLTDVPYDWGYHSNYIDIALCQFIICNPNPCKNMAKCVPTDTGFYCDCASVGNFLSGQLCGEIKWEGRQTAKLIAKKCSKSDSESVGEENPFSLPHSREPGECGYECTKKQHKETITQIYHYTGMTE